MGYKVATNQVKPDPKNKNLINTLNDKKENLKALWDIKVSQCIQALQQQGYKNVKPEDIKGIPIADGKPVQIQASVKGQDGQ
jgi:hypothetical protein